MDPSLIQLLDARTLLTIFLAFIVLGAVLSGLKVLADTKSPLRAAIAFLTALLSVQHLFQRNTGLQEKVPPKKQRGAVTLAVLVALAGAFVVGKFAWHGLIGWAALAFFVYAGILFAVSKARSGPVMALALLVVGTSSCAYVKAAGEAVKTCAGQTVSSADWNDAKPTIDGILHWNGSEALTGLGILAEKYGEQFVTCVVAELKAEYERLIASSRSAAPSQGALEAASGPERALGNANGWLARQRETL